jgi:hypothetical protein
VKRTLTCLLSLVLVSSTACRPDPKQDHPDDRDHADAIVYVDLTGSVNQQVAGRVIENVEKLFTDTPPETRFYIYAIDRGTSKPDIYHFTPDIPRGDRPTDQANRNQSLKEIPDRKRSEERGKLDTALKRYLADISHQRGPVSCLTNKLNALWDVAKAKRDSDPDCDLKIYFYSDMIEECENGFDGKPLDFKRKQDATQEKRHLDEIFERIAGFHLDPSMNLKDLGAKIHVVQASQNDKEDYQQLRAIWTRLFEKLGYSRDDLSKKEYFYWGDGADDILWNFGK